MSCTKSSVAPRTELAFGDYCEDFYGHDHCVLRTQKGESTPDPAGERIQLGFLRIHGFTTKHGRRQGARGLYRAVVRARNGQERLKSRGHLLFIHSFIHYINDFRMFTVSETIPGPWEIASNKTYLHKPL